MEYSLRTKPIKDSITKHINGAGGVLFVESQPGNGTRYQFVLVPLRDPAVAEAIGAVADSYLVTKVNGRTGVMTVGGGNFIHYSYVAEKLGTGLSDSVVIAELLGYLLGIRHVTCEEFLNDIGA